MPEAGGTGDSLGLFDGLFGRGAVREATSDRAWIAALVAFERELAAAAAEAGIIPADDAAAIAGACATVGPVLDPADLGVAAMATGSPVLPLLEALRARLPPAPAASLHHGATSQDAIDTAAMVVAAAAVRALLADLEAAAGAAADLARVHRATPMAGRTLLRQARPTTFGAAAATWLAGLDDAVARLERVRAERLAIQLGGPVGTLAELGDAGPVVVADLARRLGLAAPEQAWHTERGRVIDLATALGAAAASTAKPALDIVLLGQDELGEVRDTVAGRGGSSAMGHKRNPVAAVAARACAVQAPGLVSSVLAVAGQQELQRAAGGWHAEWLPVRDLFRIVGSGAAWLLDALGHLEVDAGRMRSNLDAAIARSGRAAPDVEADLAAAARFVDDALARREARREAGSGAVATPPARR